MISRCGDFIFEISSIAPLENTVNLTGVAPGAKSSTLRLFADTTSTPKSELDALERFFESFTTNKTLLPTLVFLPLSRGFPERPFSLLRNLSTSWDRFNASKTLTRSFDFTTDSLWSDTTTGNDSILSTLCPLSFTNVAEVVAANAEQRARRFSFLFSILCMILSDVGGCACLPFRVIATPPAWPCLPPPPPAILATLAWW